MSLEEGSITGSAAGMSPKPAGVLESKGRELGRKADEAGARLAAGLRDKAQDVSEAGQQLQQRASAAKGRVVQGVQGGRDRVVYEVQERPLRTLLVAFGAGAVIGLLLGRRPRR